MQDKKTKNKTKNKQTKKKNIYIYINIAWAFISNLEGLDFNGCF